MKPEDLLHLFAPYLATDRFRALLKGTNLPAAAQGAVLIVDISGFTPLTTQLVAEFGAQRASDELKRRLNPMFEAIAGLVFHHGGSVIRFMGDGFTAWFDDQPIGAEQPLPAGILRAVSAAVQMQEIIGAMRLFRSFRLRTYIGMGSADRWTVGLPDYGYADVLSGSAVQAALSLLAESQPEQVVVHADCVPALREAGVVLQLSETGNALVMSVPADVAERGRAARWAAWQAQGDAAQVLEAVRSYVMHFVRERLTNGLGDFVGDLRYAIPMFVKLGLGNTGRLDYTRYEAERFRSALDAYVCDAQRTLANFGGQLMSVEVSDKGCVLFAVFGAPITYGNDAERALRAALALRQIAPYGSLLGVHAIGISRGLVYAGTVGGEVRHEYSTIGDETNVAARLMGAASGGRILASSAVYKAASGRVVLEMLPEVAIKGRAEPIPVAEPISFRSSVGRRTRLNALIGRAAELERLERHLKAVQGGHPRAVRLEGEAGIGKSRLVTEVMRRAVERGFQVGQGESFSSGQLTAYLPWQSIFATLFSLPLEDAQETLRTLTFAFSQVMPEDQARLPLLGDLLGISLPETPLTANLEGQKRQQATFALVSDLLRSLAARQPLLLVLEDIQWIDESSANLVLDVVHQLGVTPSPIFLLLAHRTLQNEVTAERLVTELRSRRLHHHIPVRELSQAEIGALLEATLNERISPELLTFICERVQGNPFFALELVEALREANQLQPTAQGLAIVKGVKNLNVPQTVQGVVQARLDSLNQADQLLLKYAAVIGREFSVAILAESLPHGLYTLLSLQARLAALQNAGYLYAVKPERVFAFKHAILQEVIYQGMLSEQRAELHHSVALSVQRQMPEAIELLAYHFAQSNSREEALHYTLQAGRKAFAEYANFAALEYFAQAEALAHSPTERFEIWRRQARVLLRLGETAAVAEKLPHGAQLAEDAARDDWRMIVHLLRAEYCARTSAWAEAQQEAQKAIVLAEMLNEDRLAWQAYLILRDAMLHLSQPSAAARADLDRKMQALANRLGDQRYVIELLLTWFDEMYIESPENALQAAQTTLSGARELQDPVLEAECLSALAELYLRENNLPAAFETAQQQLARLRQIGDRRREGLTLNRIGELLINLGRISDGQQLVIDAFQILNQIGERSGAAAAQLAIGIASEYLGVYDEALSHMQRALALQESLGATLEIALTRFHIGCVYLRQQAWQAAESELTAARAIFAARVRQKPYVPPLEIDSALAMVDLGMGRYMSASERVSGMAIRLNRRQIRNLYRPTMAAWFTAQVLIANGESARAKQLAENVHIALADTFAWLQARSWLNDFLNAVWYNAELFSLVRKQTLTEA
jgi:predicted ATPase/class 3 adenylate cyclase